jgi:hypothetical protein
MRLLPEDPSREAQFCLPVPVKTESSLQTRKPTSQRSVRLMALARCVPRATGLCL